MVMPSSCTVAPLRPHIGSDGGGGIRFTPRPESQWPALPAQQGIVLKPEVALTIGSSGVTNDKATKRHRRHRIILKHRLCLLCCFVAIDFIVLAAQIKVF
jgi:hypothetical protein